MDNYIHHGIIVNALIALFASTTIILYNFIIKNLEKEGSENDLLAFVQYSHITNMYKEIIGSAIQKFDNWAFGKIFYPRKLNVTVFGYSNFVNKVLTLSLIYPILLLYWQWVFFTEFAGFKEYSISVDGKTLTQRFVSVASATIIMFIYFNKSVFYLRFSPIFLSFGIICFSCSIFFDGQFIIYSSLLSIILIIFYTYTNPSRPLTILSSYFALINTIVFAIFITIISFFLPLSFLLELFGVDLNQIDIANPDGSKVYLVEHSFNIALATLIAVLINNIALMLNFSIYSLGFRIFNKKYDILAIMLYSSCIILYCIGLPSLREKFPEDSIMRVAQKLPFICYFALIPIANFLLDSISLYVTRLLIDKGLRNSALNAIFYIFIDIIFCFLLVPLGIILNFFFIHIAFSNYIHDFSKTIEILQDMSTAPDQYLWFFLCIFSTFIPTLIHIFICIFFISMKIPFKIRIKFSELISSNNYIARSAGAFLYSIWASFTIFSSIYIVFILFYAFIEFAPGLGVSVILMVL